ncbi:MAG: bifunctional nicotinamidase/pyrazinamidase [Candidatus Omnitrophica bacterium]|nr:bifunctional nicotinamidase/pyrazinamidase [Candidatus Omnitrophota bacterium]
MKGRALLVVDVQKDFCVQGALAVPRGDEVVGVLNEYIAACRGQRIPVIASRDWHPRQTAHFREQGGMWPVHCVKDTPGAAFHPALRLPQDTIIISKGMDAGAESYSAFDGVDDRGRSLADVLAALCVEELLVGGLAADYCVKATCLDALLRGFSVSVLVDAVRGVNLSPGDSDRALEEIVSRGGRLKSGRLDR